MKTRLDPLFTLLAVLTTPTLAADAGTEQANPMQAHMRTMQDTLAAPVAPATEHQH